VLYTKLPVWILVKILFFIFPIIVL